MSQKHYFLITSTIFSIIAVLHGLRLFYGWPVTFAEWVIPVWWSWFGLAIAGFLAYIGCKFSREKTV